MKIVRVVDSMEFSKMPLNQLYQKNVSKYMKESRDGLTFMPLAEMLFVILIFFLVPHVKMIWRMVKLFEKLCDD